MQEFLEFVLRQLIDFPDEMILTKLEAPKKTVFRLRLRQSDIGKVVGKHGATIAAIRNLLNAAASRHGEKALLEIIEDQAPRAPERDTVRTSDAPEARVSETLS
jgi:hypothetical protein